ncbi:sigma-70 family RNA polymerase sigma factor [Providencia rettgeri]|uniref:sigma-70 family RNA polymerase sigma factor n=1 Tax=Providencia rettgeri TaxID=587 RepID=UPI00200B7281|nr:sigma-70 family RNA polymerase sigma factor [Providencia rettgeri]UPS62999.1 sigma-70 family RNA polymerase sigma factor [Providencia rettgeri]
MIAENNELQTLFLKIKRQDKQAFERFYNLTNRKLYGLLINIVADREIAAELLHEGYLKIWFSADNHHVIYPWAWSCQLMRNLAIDYVRKQGRSPAFEEIDISHEVFTQTDITDETETLARCFHELTKEKQQAIKLAYIHGYSHEEIVTRLSHPLGTIKSWIRRGLKELKQCINA